MKNENLIVGAGIALIFFLLKNKKQKTVPLVNNAMLYIGDDTLDNAQRYKATIYSDKPIQVLYSGNGSQSSYSHGRSYDVTLKAVVADDFINAGNIEFVESSNAVNVNRKGINGILQPNSAIPYVF